MVVDRELTHAVVEVLDRIADLGEAALSIPPSCG
jgi:hypothetical protein